MRWLLTIGLLLFFGAMCFAQDKKDINWNFDKRLTDLEKRVSNLENKTLTTKAGTGCSNCKSCGNNCQCFGGGFYCQDGKCPVEFGKVQPVQPAMRAAVGHTHTCSKGHTWDHSMDGGTHICPFCGEYQNVVSNQRFVFVPPIQQTTASPVYSLGPTYSSVGSAGGCSGSGCSMGSTRTGWYLGKRLGR